MDSIIRARKAILQADMVLIGASNGLSIAQGIHIFADNQDFNDYFSDFKNNNAIKSIIQGCFHQFSKEEQKWAFYSKMYHYFTVDRKPTQVMQQLLSLVKDKPYFVVTSNIDSHFINSGFDPHAIFEIEGNCRFMQCETACHDTLYDAEQKLLAFYAKQENGSIPTKLVPKCPKCEGNMKLNIEVDSHFVKGATWQENNQKYRTFLDQAKNKQKKIVLLELGVGLRNVLIKQPFMNFTYYNSNVCYITFNKGEIYVPIEIDSQSITLDGDIGQSLSEIIGLNGS